MSWNQLPSAAGRIRTLPPPSPASRTIEIHEALLTMAEKQVRRLPVVDQAGVPQGILSMDDSLPMATSENGRATANSLRKKLSAL
jgi:CBS domain-containing protein